MRINDPGHNGSMTRRMSRRSWLAGAHDNSLARPADRRHARLRMFCIGIWILALPIAAIFGLLIAGDGLHAAAVQASDRTPATAVLVADAPKVTLTANGTPVISSSPVAARWHAADGSTRTGVVPANTGALTGSTVAIWIDKAGQPVDPPVSFLEDVAGFESTQFSSPSVKNLAAAMAAGTSPLPDPDPVLNTLETEGKAVFNRACGQCHGNLGGHPSGSTPILQGTQGTPTAIVRYHSVKTACPRPVDTVSPPRYLFAACSPSMMANVRTYEITNSGVAPSGTPCGGPAPQPPCVTRVTTSDPGRMLLTGYPVPGGPGDIEHLDIPSLRGISRTAPYFSNNTAATLEEMLDHYTAFFKFVAITAPAAPFLTTQPGVAPPVHDRAFTDAEVPALLAYLRKI